MRRNRIFSVFFVVIMTFLLSINYLMVSSAQRSASIRTLDTSSQVIFATNDSKILMNCFIYCDFANIACMVRHSQPKYENVVFRGDNLACNFDYSGVANKSMLNWEFSIWFTQYYQSLVDNNLTLKLGHEQITYFLKNAGEYDFIVSYMPDIHAGWKFTVPRMSVYAYDSPYAYDAISTNIEMNDVFFAISIVGIIAGVLSLFFDDESSKRKPRKKRFPWMD